MTIALRIRLHRALVIGCLISAASLACSLRASGQAQTVYFSEPVVVGARALSFAHALVGDNPDVTVFYANPSALSYLENSSLILTHFQEQSTRVMEENIAMPLFLRKGEVVGIAASVNHVGYATSSPLIPFEVMQFGYDVAYSRRITPTFSMGGALHVRFARSEPSRVWGLSSSFGMYYYPTPDISYGIALTGVGSGIKYIYDGSQTLLNSESIPRKIFAGSVMRFPTKRWKRQWLNISVAAGKNFELNGVYYSGGFEILPTEFVALRAGYVGGPDNLEYGAYGVGIRLNGWKLDIGATPAKIARETYMVTISAPIWNQIDNVN